MTNRFCYYVDETMNTEHGHIPSIVTEDEPGYAPLTGNGPYARPWYWGDLPTAMALCERHNAELGLTPADVNQIVGSSMRASFAAGR